MGQFGFTSMIGYLLGLLILFVVARIFFTPIKYIIRLLFNSVIGMGILLLIHLLTPILHISIGINPVTCITIGLLGLPGLCLLLLLQIFF